MSSSHQDSLELLFPGQAFILATVAGRVLRLASQTVKNKVEQGTFPVLTHLVSGYRVVRKIYLAFFLDGLGDPARIKTGPAAQGCTGCRGAGMTPAAVEKSLSSSQVKRYIKHLEVAVAGGASR